MSGFLSQLLQKKRPGEPGPKDLVLAQRERLLGCALQILQDGAAAQEVVLKGLGQALQSPLLVPLSADAGDALGRWLDRLVVHLSLTHLRQAAPLRPGARGAIGTDCIGTGVARPLTEALRRPQIPMSLPAPTSREAPSRQGAPGDPPPRCVPGELQQLERLAQALRALSPEARVTVALVTMQGRRPAEVAELLGCSEESCRFWLRHGRKLLRRALQRDLIEAEPEPPPESTASPTGVLHDLRRGKKAAARA